MMVETLYQFQLLSSSFSLHVIDLQILTSLLYALLITLISLGAYNNNNTTPQFTELVPSAQ